MVVCPGAVRDPSWLPARERSCSTSSRRATEPHRGRVRRTPRWPREAKRARALDEVGLAARAAEWPHPEWNPAVPEPEVSLD